MLQTRKPSVNTILYIHHMNDAGLTLSAPERSSCLPTELTHLIDQGVCSFTQIVRYTSPRRMSDTNFYRKKIPKKQGNSQHRNGAGGSRAPRAHAEGLSGPIDDATSEKILGTVKDHELFNDEAIEKYKTASSSATTADLRDAEIRGALKVLTGVAPIFGNLLVTETFDAENGKLGSVQLHSIRGYSKQQAAAQLPRLHQEETFVFEKQCAAFNQKQGRVKFNMRLYKKPLDVYFSDGMLMHLTSKLASNEKFCGGTKS